MAVTVLPQAVNDNATTLAGTEVQILPLAKDLCANCALTGLDTPTSGTAVRTGDVVTFAPSETGTATFDYHAQDGSSDTFTGTVTVEVVSAPLLADDAAATPNGIPVTVEVLSNDECPVCDVSIDSDPSHGTVAVDVFNRAVYSASPGYSGIDTFRYTATDPVTGAWASALVTVTVTPVARDDTAATGAGVAITVDVLANDACTGCTVSIDQATAGAATTVVSGGIRVAPDAGFTGLVTVHYTATDPSTVERSDAVLTVDVSDARPDSTTTPYGIAVIGLPVLANDICVGCTVTGVTPCVFRRSVVRRLWCQLDAAVSSFACLVTFGYTADNGVLDGVSSTVRILVTPPVRHINVLPNSAGTVHVLAAGACTGCVVTLQTPPENADLDEDGIGGFTYTPADSWTGTDSFDYRVTDPVSGEHVDSSVTVTVGSAPAEVPSVALTGTASDPGSGPRAGDSITWTWIATNTGEVPLTNLVVTGSPSCETGLAVGASTSCSTMHALTQQEIDAGEVIGSGDVSADSASGLVTDSASVAPGAMSSRRLTSTPRSGTVRATPARSRLASASR